jgi:hypothetical protein
VYVEGCKNYFSEIDFEVVDKIYVAQGRVQ